MYVFYLFQTDGFPTLLFFPAGNKSFDPVSTLYFLTQCRRYFLIILFPLPIVHEHFYDIILKMYCNFHLFTLIPKSCRSQWILTEQWRHSIYSSSNMQQSLSSSRSRQQLQNLRPPRTDWLPSSVRRVRPRTWKMNCKSFKEHKI